MIKQRGQSGRQSKNGQRQNVSQVSKSVRRKKTARLAGGFSGILGVLRALTPLSIRQRSEIPKKVKIKLGGHGEVNASLVKKGE
ncbi:hypothetical protein [Paraburkholderia sp. MM5384-R2]|uniref:hypothetical protein n=1 Tax=Paraburkholderia sp. MM5384-R2 TaxID=2723097 RepID=UPI001622C5C3|nr:hypothetical protein [Paraburkholderia sp. MM5384-R2]MBB5502918.1 hypothetical protein [Paraburkholderia sp. MM5384-R2]